jgi:hypothetical protein
MSKFRNRAPRLGDIVLYKLTDEDEEAIKRQRLAQGSQIFPGNPASAGTIYPAMVVATFGVSDPGSPVNIKVLLDGNDTLWALSRRQYHGQGDCIQGMWEYPE